MCYNGKISWEHELVNRNPMPCHMFISNALTLSYWTLNFVCLFLNFIFVSKVLFLNITMVTTNGSLSNKKNTCIYVSN